MNNRERWVFLFLLGLLLFNWPFLEIFSLSLPYYLFGIWGLYVLMLHIVVTVIQRRGD